MNPFLIIIGIFVFFAARAEASFVKTKFALGGHQVKELMMDIFTPLYTDETLSRAAKALLDGQEQEFVVLNREGAFVGILSREDILKGLSTFGKDCIIEKVVNPNVPGINADDQIEEVFFNMSKNQFDALPVLDDGKVIGVINRENIMEFIWIKEAVDKNLSA